MNSWFKKFEWKANLLCHCNLFIRKSIKVYAFEGPPISKTYCYCQSQEILFIQHLQMAYFWRNLHDQMHFFSWRASDESDAIASAWSRCLTLKKMSKTVPPRRHEFIFQSLERSNWAWCYGPIILDLSILPIYRILRIRLTIVIGQLQMTHIFQTSAQTDKPI